MSSSNLSAPLKWLAMVALLANLLAVAYWANQKVKTQRAADTPPAPKRDDDPGDVTLPTRVADSLPVEVENPRREEPWAELLTVYGQVVPNPLATAEIRAPFAGTLRENGAGWPQPGQWLKAGDVLGWVDIRVSPQDRLDLQNKLNEALRKHKGARETLQLKKANLDRFEAAFQDKPRSVPLRELEEARLQYSEAQTQEALAQDAVQLWQDALAEIDRAGPGKSSKWSQPLKAPAAGEVTDLVGRSGTAVEAGGLVLRLVDFRRPLVRLDLPPDVVLKEPPRTVDLYAVTPPPAALNGVRNLPLSARPGHKIHANLIGTTAGVNPASQYASYLFEVDAHAAKDERESIGTRPEVVMTDGLVWRPGLLVKAQLPGLPDPQVRAVEAVSVPAKAVLFHEGRALVYLQRRKDDKTIRFSRFEVRLLGRKDDRWVLTCSQHIDDQVQVVVNNAQALLSEEFKKDVDDD